LSNRRCPRCHNHYAAPARFCPTDGTPLVEVAPAPAQVANTAQARAIERAAEPADPVYTSLNGRTISGRYCVERRLGEGGMSYVYLAQDLETDREVALKVLSPRLIRDPASVERLKREAAIAMRLDHPNVCPILGLGETPERFIYLVMPYLPGEPLSEHEIRQGALSVAEGVPLLLQICRGLEHAHKLEIVHRDLKPENVMLVPDPTEGGGSRAVVMDFGLAKERRAEPEVVKLTQTGIVLGTPEFMSPEQIRGKPLDGRSDVYALGVLAFELFTGRLPFVGKSPQDMMLARLRGEPLHLRSLRPELPARLEAVIDQALAKDPAARIQSMEEFGAALAAVTGTTGVFGRWFGR
jgi:eukaryotic-like serine/threonine-protein kinase